MRVMGATLAYLCAGLACCCALPWALGASNLMAAFQQGRTCALWGLPISAVVEQMRLARCVCVSVLLERIAAALDV